MSPNQPLCKICEGPTESVGECDFNKSGNDHFEKRRLFAKSEIRVPYVRCVDCGFMYTEFFDDWTPQDFRERVYNDDYILADPPFTKDRPVRLANYLASVIDEGQYAALSHLDYGAGEGRLVAELNSRGYAGGVCFDPHYARGQPMAPRRFDLLTAFEVVEHVTEQVQLFRAWVDMLGDAGLIVMSTLIQPDDIRELGADWWYACPRNGHLSFHTHASLRLLADKFGLSVISVSEELHLVFGAASSLRERFVASTAPAVNC